MQANSFYTFLHAGKEEWQKIVIQKADLSYQIETLQKKIQTMETAQYDLNDNYEYKLATLGNDLSGKVCELSQLREESCQKLTELQSMLKDMSTKLEEREERLSLLTEANLKLGKIRQQIDSENMDLKSQIENLRMHLKKGEVDLQEENAGCKKALKDANVKICDLSKERESLATDLNTTKKHFDDLKKNSETDIEKLREKTRDQKLRIETESTQFVEETLKLTKKLEEMSQELTTKTNDFQNLQKYLNDVQNDREEEIKQYDTEVETLKAESNTAAENFKVTEGLLKSSNELREFEVSTSTTTISELSTDLDTVRKQLTIVVNDKNALIQKTRKFEEDLDQLAAKNVELENQMEEDRRQHMISLDNYNAEYEAKSMQAIELDRLIGEMKESHVSECAGYRTRIEELQKQSEFKKAEHEACIVEWERKTVECSENSQQMIKGELFLF